MQAKVTALVREAIMVLCKNSLTYTTTFNVEGVLNVTLDCAQTFPIHINETIGDPSLIDPSLIRVKGEGRGAGQMAATTSTGAPVKGIVTN